jgi:hypothetical protein
MNMPELPQKVISLCQETSAEPVYIANEETLVFIVPKIPSAEVQAKMAREVPGFIHTRWMEALKTTTMGALKTLFSQLGATGDIHANHGAMKIVLTEVKAQEALEKDSPLWATLVALCKADGYPSSLKVILDQDILFSWDKSIERMLAEHINTGLVIKDDDILNLTIALETTHSVEEFLATI